MATDEERSASAQTQEEDVSLKKGTPTRKAMSIVLEEAEVIELIRVLMDDDAEGALSFLKVHFKGKARDLLEGG